MNKKPYSYGSASGKARDYNRVLDAVARDQIPAGMNLAPTILARIQQGKGVRMQPRIRPLSAALLVVLALLIVSVTLFFTVPAVAAAIGRWFGYVPGVGLVREGSVRVLAEPVSVTRDGVTVTVDQLVLNQEETALVYTVEGIPTAAQLARSSPGQAQCDYRAILRLPDGSELLASPTGLDYWGAGYQHRFHYAALPAAVNEAKLVIPCLYHTRPGAAPENWEIPLRFAPAPADMTALPVIEIPSPTAPAPTETAAAAPAASSTPAPDSAAAANPAEPNLRLTLDRAVQMEDGYLLYATLHWEDTAFTTVDLPDEFTALRLLDGSGQPMLYEQHYDESTGMQYDARQTVFALKTAPVQASGPLTVALDWVIAGLPSDGSFVFDPGANLTPPQEWEVDIDVPLGERSLRVRKVSTEGSGYSFDMTSTSGIHYAMLGDPEHPLQSGVDGPSETVNGESAFYSSFYYMDGLPAGPITVRVGGIAVRHAQPLTVQWTPPAASPAQLPTQPAACLTAAAWQNALAQPGAIPAGLANTVLTNAPADPNVPGEEWVLALSALDGSNRQVIDGASDGSFSPDGARLAYSVLQFGSFPTTPQPADSTSEGIFIMDLASGEATHVPGTRNGDFNPMWSPDGQSVVFNRGMGIFDLFLTSLDGAHVQQLTQGGVQEWPVGWLSDGSFLYTVPGRENEYTTYRLDLASGERTEYALDDSSSVSPDGKRIISIEKTFGDRMLVYISEADGSNRWLVAGADLWVLNPTLSPDGEWLLASVSVDDPGKTIGALINLRTCEVFALPELRGSILGWSH